MMLRLWCAIRFLALAGNAGAQAAVRIGQSRRAIRLRRFNAQAYRPLSERELAAGLLRPQGPDDRPATHTRRWASVRHFRPGDTIVLVQSAGREAYDTRAARREGSFICAWRAWCSVAVRPL